MRRKLQFTRQAESALVDILVWTTETFRAAQADRYEDLVIGRLAALADGSVVDRSLARLVDIDLNEAYRAIRVGQHYAVVVIGDDIVRVVTFLHVRSDLPGHAAALPDPDDI